MGFMASKPGSYTSVAPLLVTRGVYLGLSGVGLGLSLLLVEGLGFKLDDHLRMIRADGSSGSYIGVWVGGIGGGGDGDVGNSILPLDYTSG